MSPNQDQDQEQEPSEPGPRPPVTVDPGKMVEIREDQPTQPINTRPANPDPPIEKSGGN